MHKSTGSFPDALALFCALTLLPSGCAFVGGGAPAGLLYTNTRTGRHATSAPHGELVGRACSTFYLGLVAVGDSSIDTARKNGGITTISIIDEQSWSILFGLYAKHCTIVHGRAEKPGAGAHLSPSHATPGRSGSSADPVDPSQSSLGNPRRVIGTASTAVNELGKRLEAPPDSTRPPAAQPDPDAEKRARPHQPGSGAEPAVSPAAAATPMGDEAPRRRRHHHKSPRR